MMGQPRVVPGFTVAYSPKKVITAPMNANLKTCWGTDGVLHGRTIAALFTTGLRRVQMASLGASARNWFGGTRKRRSGVAWITQITQKPCHLTEKPISKTARESRLSAALSLLLCIPMESLGCLYRAD